MVERRTTRFRIPGLLSALLTLANAGCGDPSAAPILLGPEGNRLHAYATDGSLAKQVLISSYDDAPGQGRDINGQICVQPGTRRFVSGEDTGQPSPPPGFGVFELLGDEVGSVGWRQIGKLNPTFQGEPGPEGVSDTADPYGCGFLPDGRLLTTDIGNTASGPGNGQLILWFPPLDATEPRFCKLDVEIATAQSLHVDAEGAVWVAASRSGVWRYDGPFPTGDDAAHGCGRRDATGAPLADQIKKTLAVPSQSGLAAPAGVISSAVGTLFVSSVIDGVIAEVSTDGRLLRRVLQPPAGESFGAEPYSTGTPLGITIDPHGTLYYADIAIGVRPNGIGPLPNRGSVRRIRFIDGEPQPPETLASGLAFPDGVGIILP